MHMSDALLSPSVGLAFGAATAGLSALAARRVTLEPGYDRRLPLAGVLGAFVFGAQMVNFAIPGTGSSGHLGGALLLAILLGPWAAFLALLSVLVVQALFFADGGLLALGCNVFNLGFWPAFVGLALYRSLRGRDGGAGREMFAIVVAALVSVEAGALGVALQAALSGRAELPFDRFAPLMLAIHLPIALVEGFVTAGVVRFVRRLAPDRLAEPVAGAVHASGFRSLAAIAGVTFFVAAGASFIASTRPDGLEWATASLLGPRQLAAPASAVASSLSAAQGRTALMADYGLPSTMKAGPYGPALAGVAGALLVGLAVLGFGALARLGRRGRPS
jgi:cobalt/nickel transport system permease protein